MNQKILTLVLAFFVMGIAACKKDEKALTCQLIARSNGVDSATITYDAQGRVSSYGTASSTYTFTYSGLTAQCVVSTPANPNAGSYNVYLNGDGTVSSMSESITFSGNTLYYNYSFKYNSEGRVRLCEQSLTSTDGSFNRFYIDSMVYTNGNRIAQYSFSASSPTGPFTLDEYATTSYTEYTNRINYHAFSSSEEPITMVSSFMPFYHLFGKGSKNLPEETSVYDNTGSLVYKRSYTYLFDEEGNVKEQNQSRSILAPRTDNIKFYYTCK